MLDKLEKLDKIEAHLSEVSASLASIEEKVSHLDEDVQDLKQKTEWKRKRSELEERIQSNKDDNSDLKKDSKESKFEINDLRKQSLYLETYSRRENVKFFGIDEVVPASEVVSPPEDTRDLLFKFLENKLRIETLVVESSSKESIDWESLTTAVTNLAQLSHVSYDIRTRKLWWDQARKELKSQEDKQFSVFDDIPKELYEIRKSQMKKFKEARGKGCTVYFSKAQPDKLFVNGKFIPANAPLTDFV